MYIKLNRQVWEEIKADRFTANQVKVAKCLKLIDFQENDISFSFLLSNSTYIIDHKIRQTDTCICLPLITVHIPTLTKYSDRQAHVYVCLSAYEMSRDGRKPDICICENKDADQLRGNREADQRLCLRQTDSEIPLLPKSEISIL